MKQSKLSNGDFCVERLVLVLYVIALAFQFPSTALSQRQITGIDDTTDVIDHTRFDSLWQESIVRGKISTRGYYSTAYSEYRELMKGAEPDAFLPDSRYAFWVNSYLACLYEVIHLSVGYRSTVWDSAYLKRDTFWVARRGHCLKDLQDSVLSVSRTMRAVAFFCTGSSSAPPFPGQLPRAKTVRRVQREMMRRVCRSEKYLLFDPAGPTLQVIRFFEPFGSRIVEESGSLAQFVIPYVTEAIAAQMALRLKTLRYVYSDRIENWRKAR